PRSGKMLRSMKLKTHLAVVLTCAGVASADVTVRLDNGVAHAVSAPTRDYFGLGLHAGGTVGLGLLSFLDVGLHLEYVFLSRSGSSPLPGPTAVVALGPA